MFNIFPNRTRQLHNRLITFSRKEQDSLLSEDTELECVNLRRNW